MRPALVLLAALAGASAAAAQPTEDRYGPARAQPVRMASNTAGAAYQGRLLTWSSRNFTPQVPEAPRMPQPAPPVAAATPRSDPPAPAPRPAAPAPLAARPAPVRAAASPPALPDSLYAPPPPSPAAPPVRLAQARPAPEPAAGSHVRLYSVHRQYGLTPDAIPAAPTGSNYVLIAPREGAPRDDEGGKASDSDDRPF